MIELPADVTIEEFRQLFEQRFLENLRAANDRYLADLERELLEGTGEGEPLGLLAGG